MATYLKEDVRFPVQDGLRLLETCDDAVAHEVVGRTEAVQTEDGGREAVFAVSQPLARRSRWLLEAGCVAVAVLGLVLVPSVQSVGLAVDPVGISPASDDAVQLSHKKDDSVVSREVIRLIGRD